MSAVTNATRIRVLCVGVIAVACWLLCCGVEPGKAGVGVSISRTGAEEVRSAERSAMSGSPGSIERGAVLPSSVSRAFVEGDAEVHARTANPTIDDLSKPTLVCPAGAYDVALLFWRAPLKVSVERLMGSSYLNPGKVELSAANHSTLAEIISRHREEIAEMGKKSASARHAQALDLQARGELIELNESLLSPSQLIEVRARASAAYRMWCPKLGVVPSDDANDPMLLACVATELEKMMRALVPGGASIVKKDGKTFVATEGQLTRSGPLDKDYYNYLRDNFLGEVLTLLTGVGVTPADTVASVAAAYEGLSKSGR